MPRFRMEPLRANNVLQLFRWREEINLDPPYQRLSVWDRLQSQTFIDSVLNGFDIPKLYFHEVRTTAGENAQYRYAVIDGKQRLLALWDFMSNKLPLAGKFEFFDDPTIRAAGLTYDELMTEAPRLRARFDDFDVPITVVRSEDENFVDDLFSRLNTQVSLSAAERRNALGGPLPFVIRRIGLSPFVRDYVSIDNKRFQRFDLAAKFLYLTYVGDVASTKKAELDGFVLAFRQYREDRMPEASRANLEELYQKTEAVLEEMQAFFSHSDPLLASSGRITLYFHIFRRHRELHRKIPFTRVMLEEFNERVTAARKKSHRRAGGSDEELTGLEQTLVDFDREKQTPNDGGAMRRQYALFRKYFAEMGVDLPESLEP